MIKETVKYTDFNGNEQEEVCYFNLTKAEATMWEHSVAGGMSNKMKGAVDTQDTKTMTEIMYDLVLRAYGIKSEDGKKFVKNESIKNDFESSPIFSEMFMTLVTNEEKSATFMEALISK